MNFFPSQLSLLLIPGVATWFAVSTLQGGRAMERRPRLSYVRWLHTSGIVLNTLGLIGVASLFVGYVSLLIILPALSLVLTVWMTRRRRAQLRFAWGLLIAKQHELPAEPLATAISETSPWWTRRQLRAAVLRYRRGDSALKAIHTTGIPIPIEIGLALSENSISRIESEKLLQRFETLSATRQSYREFIRLWNYFMAIGFLSIVFMQFVSPSLGKLVREMALQQYSGFPTPTQFLEDYGLTTVPFFVLSVFACLFVVVFTLVLNLDQLELWPWNWWPSSRLHRRWFQAVTLEHACREAAAGRSWQEIFLTLSAEHPLRRVRNQSRSISESSNTCRIATGLYRHGWISNAIEKRASSESHTPQHEAKLLLNVALQQQTAVAEAWRRITVILRWIGTLVCGFFVGWIALAYFDLFTQLIRQNS